jgi:hypothetical protein
MLLVPTMSPLPTPWLLFVCHLMAAVCCVSVSVAAVAAAAAAAQAIRGGAGLYGIVTSWKFKLYKAPEKVTNLHTTSAATPYYGTVAHEQCYMTAWLGGILRSNLCHPLQLHCSAMCIEVVAPLQQV